MKYQALIDSSEGGSRVSDRPGTWLAPSRPETPPWRLSCPPPPPRPSVCPRRSPGARWLTRLAQAAQRTGRGGHSLQGNEPRSIWRLSVYHIVTVSSCFPHLTKKNLRGKIVPASPVRTRSPILFRGPRHHPSRTMLSSSEDKDILSQTAGQPSSPPNHRPLTRPGSWVI